MLISCTSDCHGNLNFKVPESDLLLIAGDLCPASHNSHLSIDLQANWLNYNFREWLLNQPIKECVCVSGNHDWIWEVAPDRVPKMNKKFHYIEDEIIEIIGLKIYGTPVQPSFNNWAFNREEKSLQKYWNNIPKGLDILLLHCPPYGVLDKTKHPNYESKRIGSKSLLKKIEEVKPKLVVFGHNHADHGIVEKNDVKYINASLVNEQYEMIREPITIEI
jgi:Icc-related predicted phosphoesterase